MAAQMKYPDELRERAVRMVLEIRERDGRGQGELARVVRQLGVHPEALGGWAKKRQAEPSAHDARDAYLKEKIMETWAGCNEFFIGDVPALPILRNNSRPGVLGGTAFGEGSTFLCPSAHSMLLPLLGQV